MLEPIILPKLLIYFADFPYLSCLRHWATHPRVLLQFGTTVFRLFYQAVPLLLSITLHRSPGPANLHAPPSSCHHYIAIPEPSCEYLHIPLLYRIASPPSIKRMNPTRNVLIIIATTSKICSKSPSTPDHPSASQQPLCQSTNMQVSHHR